MQRTSVRATETIMRAITEDLTKIKAPCIITDEKTVKIPTLQINFKVQHNPQTPASYFCR